MSYGNEFDLHENIPTSRRNTFSYEWSRTRHRQKTTRKLPIMKRLDLKILTKAKPKLLLRSIKKSYIVWNF